MVHTMRFIVAVVGYSRLLFRSVHDGESCRYSFGLVRRIPAGSPGYRSQCGHQLDADREYGYSGRVSLFASSGGHLPANGREGRLHHLRPVRHATHSESDSQSDVSRCRWDKSTEKVTVEANAELVTTRSATGGQLVNQRLVVDLPLNGRGAQSLVFIAPGTVNLTGRYCGVDCHGGVYPGEQVAGVNGAGSAQVNYQMDGTDHNDTYINMNLPFPNPDALQEFNLQSSNFTAEYGNAGGGIVNIVTKSGHKRYSRKRLRIPAQWFAERQELLRPAQDTLKRNQFGGTIGGPIVKEQIVLLRHIPGHSNHQRSRKRNPAGADSG